MKTLSIIPSTAQLTIASLSHLKNVSPLSRISTRSLVPDTHVAVFTSFVRATSRACSNAALLLFSVAMLLAGGAEAVRGQSALDGFDPGANDYVAAVAVQADGKILVGGRFTKLGGGGTGTTTRNYIGRLNPDGSLDTSFNPGANNQVHAFAVQADGKILVGGTFTTLGGGGTGTTPRNRIGRLNPDGSLDTSFDPGANTAVETLAVQVDGKILVGGYFTTLGGGGTGTTVRKAIGRLNPNGKLDTSFDPGANNGVLALAVQADGKILVGGGFTTFGGGGTGTTARNYIGRLNQNGTLDTSFDPGANGYVYALAVQADGRILAGGFFATLGGGGTGTTARSRIGRLHSNGKLDTSFDPGANNGVLALAVQADGKILVGGDFTTLGGGSTGTTMRNKIGRLNPSGSLDTSFNPGANFAVEALAVQADGKILVGGFFTTLGGGGTGTTTRNKIGRLETDGRLDRTLNLGTVGVGSIVEATAVQPDGKILIGGQFNTVLSQTRHNIARLNPDGTLDTAFDPNATGPVYSIAVQADGKILVGGNFSNIGTQPRNNIARLGATTGAADSFNPNAFGFIYCMAVQGDGQILVGGTFSNIGGQPRNNIARLSATTGAADSSFNPNANDRVLSIAVQADGKIWAGGYFHPPNSIGGGTRAHIARLHPMTGLVDDSLPDTGPGGFVDAIVAQTDGSVLVGGQFTMSSGAPHNNILRMRSPLDLNFDPNATDTVYVIAVQEDGKVLAGGEFRDIGGQPRDFIARLDGTTGTADSFNPDANNYVYSIAVQADGKILAGGAFTSIGGQTRNAFARFTNNTAALQDLAVAQTTITWTRGGASPQLTRVTFESSTNNVNYIPLGDGTGAGSNWMLTGLDLPIEKNFYIRARGYYRSGYRDGSESITESVRNAFIWLPPTPTAVVSRKIHGGAAFDINLPLTGSPGIECRTGGAQGNHLVFATFAVPVTFTFAAVTSGAGSVASATGSGTTKVTVNLTGVTNAQKITITLFGLSDGTNTADLGIPMGVLLGDVTGGSLVNASDISQTKSKAGQPVGSSNFRTDVTVTNSINASDIALVKSKSGTALP